MFGATPFGPLAPGQGSLGGELQPPPAAADDRLLVINLTLQDAATAGDGLTVDTEAEARELAFYVIGSAGVSAGEVRIEEAHDEGYTGTWSPVGSPVTVVASAVQVRRLSGAIRAVRAVISAAVVGGTVTVLLMGTAEGGTAIAVSNPPVYPQSVTIELGLGGIFRHRFINEADMVSVYPLSETKSSTARDIVFDRNPGLWVGSSGFTRGVPLGFPEGGLGCEFDGDGYVEVPNDGDGYRVNDEAGNRNLSCAGGDINVPFLFRNPVNDASLRAIAQKQETNATGNGWHVALQNRQIVFYLKVSGVVIFNMARNIPIGTNLMLGQCIFDSALGEARILFDGVQEGTTVTVAPIEPAETTANFRIGMFNNGVAGDGSGFIGLLAYVGISRNANPNLSADLLPTMVWTDVSEDVLISQMPIQWRRGIRGGGVQDNVAGPGTLTFALDNATSNSAGLQGYYTVGHANCRSGFKVGNPARLTITYEGTPSVKFTGLVKSADPQPGEWEDQFTAIACVDWMHVAMRSFTSALPIQLNATSDVLLGHVIDAAERTPAAIQLYAGSDQFPFAFDSSRGEDDTPMTEIVRITASERGFFYVLGDGTVVGEGRALRQMVLETAATFLFQHGLVATYDVDRIINVVRAIFYPRRVDPTNTTVLASMPAASSEHFVPPGGVVELESGYRDPDQKIARVGGTDMQAPTPVTDYTMFENADGTGLDLTSQFTVRAVDGGNLVRWLIENHSESNGAFITKLQARGRGLYYLEAHTVIARDTDSLREHGERPLRIDLPYQSALASALGIANTIVSLFKQVNGSVPVTATLLANYSRQTMVDVLARDLGDSIALQEPLTAIGMDALIGYFIQSEEGTIEAGDIVTVSWGLSLPVPTGAWVLGEAGFSELGETTYVGF